MILYNMEKWLISPKTRYMYHHFEFGRHSKIDAVITLFQCKYHLHSIQCAKTHFQPLKRRFCPCDCPYCARQCTWCHFNAHIWSSAEWQIFDWKCFYLGNIRVYNSFRDDFEYMEKWLISPKTRYMYHHFGFGWHSKIDAVIITLGLCKYHLPNIQCAKTRFQHLKRLFCPCDCIYCAR